MRDVRIPRYKCIVCGKTPDNFSAFMARTCLGICTKCCIDFRFTEAQVQEKFNKQRKEVMEKYPHYARPFHVRRYEMNRKYYEEK